MPRRCFILNFRFMWEFYPLFTQFSLVTSICPMSTRNIAMILHWFFLVKLEKGLFKKQIDTLRMPQFRSGTVLKKNIENCCLGSSSQSGFRSKRACAVILLPYSSMLCHPPRSRFLRTGNGVDVCRYNVYQSIWCVLNSFARKCLIFFGSKVWKLHPLRIISKARHDFSGTLDHWVIVGTYASRIH